MSKHELHGMSGSSEYQSWLHAKYRVFNPSHNSYHNYGGRGITMCKEWAESFEQFYKDLGPMPEGTSLDRIDTDGNYEPSNCRWLDTRLQHLNKRTNTNHPGIFHTDRPKPWRVRIRVGSKRIHIGYFSTLKEAFKARKKAEKQYWGVYGL